MTHRVVLVDDQELVRVGLAALLARADDIEVVGEAADGRQALTVCREVHPDVVLMDVRMPVLDGVEATRAIVADPGLKGTRVVVLTTFDTDETIFAALEAGAAGFLTKDVEPDDLRAAVLTVAAGHGLLSPSVTTRVVDRAVRGGEVDPRAAGAVARLTERELEVLRLVARGRTNDELAAELFLSPATARTYVSRLLTKLDARDRVALVLLAHRAGLA